MTRGTKNGGSNAILADTSRVTAVTILAVIAIGSLLSPPVQFGYRPAEAATTVIDSNTTLTDFTVAAGDQLVINSGVDLTLSGTTTNNGEIINNGRIFTDSTIDNNGLFDNKGEFAILSGTTTNHGTINNDGSISVEGDFINEDTVSNQGEIIGVGAINNNGNIENSGRIGVSSVGYFYNYGTIDNDNSGSVYDVANIGTVNNLGRLISSEVGHNYPSGIINNHGDFDIQGGYTNRGAMNNNGTMDISFGEFKNAGAVNNDCGGIINLSSATITGNPVNDLCDDDDDDGSGDGGNSGDSDNDGVADGDDNCPTASNPAQADLDGDGIGDACDENNTVEIDIKPGDDRVSRINLDNTRGSIRIAIFGTGDFDASKIERATVNFEGAQPVSTGFRDINEDGFKDLIPKFEIRHISSLEEGDTEGCLTGELDDGTAFEGCEEVRVID